MGIDQNYSVSTRQQSFQPIYDDRCSLLLSFQHELTGLTLTATACLETWKTYYFQWTLWTLYLKLYDYISFWSEYKQASKRNKISRSQKCRTVSSYMAKRCKKIVCVCLCDCTGCVINERLQVVKDKHSGITAFVPDTCSSQLRYHPGVCFHLSRSCLNWWVNQRIWKKE